MDQFDKIKNAYENNRIPDRIWLEELQTILEDAILRQAGSKESVLKYSKTEKGKLKRRQAQARYYYRQKDLLKQKTKSS